jgi:CRISPR-associated Cas5-like protein
VRWFAARFHVAPERLLIVSRGGTASWYRPFAAGYRETFDYLTPEQFRQRHDERVAVNGEQKQTQVLAFERELLRELTTDVQPRSMLHPSSMYGLFNPFWWGHVGESWVHAHASYARLCADRGAAFVPPSGPYTAVKFYFNECFPPTDENRAFARRTLQVLAERGPVVSLATSLRLDDHDHDDELQALGVQTLPGHLHPRDNLALQTAAVAGAERFVGTYGGFSYLAPFLGVPAHARYSNVHGFSPRHLSMVRSALGSIGAGGLLDVRPTGPAADPLLS